MLISMLDYNQCEIIFKALALRKILKLFKGNLVVLYEDVDYGLITISIFCLLDKSSNKKQYALVDTC